MKRLALTLLMLLPMVGLAAPAQARGYVSVGIGCCAGGYYPYHPYYPYYAPYYGYPAYYYPPAPTVVYTQPAPTTYVVQQPAPVPFYPSQQPPQAAPYAPAGATAQPTPVTPPSNDSSTMPPPSAAPQSAVNEATPTFVDDKGRTCRKFQTMIDTTPVTGTACLQPDGSWRSVDE